MYIAQIYARRRAWDDVRATWTRRIRGGVEDVKRGKWQTRDGEIAIKRQSAGYTLRVRISAATRDCHLCAVLSVNTTTFAAVVVPYADSRLAESSQTIHRAIDRGEA